jgi:predicted nucleic acid-binding Zn ribbon protein
MPPTKPDANTCPSCGEQYPRSVAVCPGCKVILAKPDGRAKTPLWLIILLLVVIVALSVWLVLELKRVFIDRETGAVGSRAVACRQMPLPLGTEVLPS